MAIRKVSGVSSAPAEDDIRRRTIVDELMQAESKAIIEFAKTLVTLSFSAIGVVLALKDKWLGPNPPSWQRALLGCSVALFLATSLLATMAAAAYGHRVSLSDFGDVDAELHRVARRRYKLTMSAFGLALLAVMVTAAMVIYA